MTVRLTETAISKASREAVQTEQRKDLADAGCPGLRLRLTPPSRKTRDLSAAWWLCCRDREGRMRRYPLGAYPGLTISKAREEAKALHVKVRREGADPVAEHKRQRAIGRDAKAGIGTLAALLKLYEAQAGAKLKTWAESKARIERVFKVHLDRPIATMKAADLQLTADGRPSANSAAGAVRCLRPILKWAAQRRYVSVDLASIVPPARVRRRERVLSRDELGRLLPILRKSGRAYAECMRFLLFTLARRGEAEGARWGDIDMIAGTWRISETKNGQPHVVPLSTQALALLRQRLPKDDDGHAVEPSADGLVFSTAAGTVLANWDREAKAIMKASKTNGWHRHDLRRTGATMLGDMGELPDIIEAALNHVAIHSLLAATYNRSRYRPQVAAALQRLADALDGIETESAKILPLALRV